MRQRPEWLGETEKEQMVRTQRTRGSPPDHWASVTGYGVGRTLRVSAKTVLLRFEKKNIWNREKLSSGIKLAFLERQGEKKWGTLQLKKNSSKPWNKSCSDLGEKRNPKLRHGNVPILQNTDAVRGLQIESVLSSGWTCFSSSQRQRRAGRNEAAQLREDRAGLHCQRVRCKHQETCSQLTLPFVDPLMSFGSREHSSTDHFQCPRFGQRKSLKTGEENFQIWEMGDLLLKGERNFIVKTPTWEVLRSSDFDRTSLQYSVHVDAITFILGLRAWEHTFMNREAWEGLPQTTKPMSPLEHSLSRQRDNTPFKTRSGWDRTNLSRSNPSLCHSLNETMTPYAPKWSRMFASRQLPLGGCFPEPGKRAVRPWIWAPLLRQLCTVFIVSTV